ncbi:MAG: stage II sporulation protein M [Blautia sp.]
MNKYFRILFLLFLVGFAGGILCANYLQASSGYETSLLGIYMAEQGTETISRSQVFWHLLKKRAEWFLVYFISGMTPFGVPLVWGGILWFGFLAGNLMTAFLMEYGLVGILTGLICFFPQGFFYLPAWIFFFFFILQMSQKFWQTQGRTSGDYGAYFFFMTGIFVLFLLGIFMESYVNQKVLNYVVRNRL